MQAANSVLTITVNPPIPVVDTTDSRVTVTAMQITTPDDVIPIPQTGLRLVIPAGETLVWDQVDDTGYDAVLVYGTLRFARNVPTRLRCTTLIVFPGGVFDRGTEADPITAKSEIIVNDAPLDPVNDPGQYWNGLINLGTILERGLTRTRWLRCSVEPKAGDTTLTLESAPVGWQVGDTLVLPDSRQLLESEKWSHFVPQWERPKILSIAGNVVTLTAPLLFNHLGSYNGDGGSEFKPHVGNLTSNVITKSENVNGVRHHVMNMRRAYIDIEQTQYTGGGRTTSAAISATNIAGRLPMHFHHCYGPVTVPAGKPQVNFSNNAVWCPLDPMPFRWGLWVHDTHFGRFVGNVAHNWAGVGIGTETGNETQNLFDGNFVVGVRGNSNPRNDPPDGLDGSCFWLRSFNNLVRNNVAASAANAFQGIVTGIGYNIGVPAATKKDTKIPAFPSADPAVNFTLVDRQAQPLLDYSDNEAYGCMATGYTFWHINRNLVTGAGVRSFVYRMKTWHTWEEGFFGYPIRDVSFVDCVDIGDKTKLNAPGGDMGWTCGDYFANGIVIRNFRCSNRKVGIAAWTNTIGDFRIESPDMQCSIAGISVDMLATPGTQNQTGPRKTTIVSPKFRPMPGYPNALKIRRAYPTNLSAVWLVILDEVFVQDMDGVAGDNFELFINEQRPDFIIPQNGIAHGSPAAGLTNQQNLDTYGICIGGKLLPAAAVDRAGIGGKVLPTGILAAARETLGEEWDGIPLGVS